MTIGIGVSLKTYLAYRQKKTPTAAVIYGGSAGPALSTRIGHTVEGLFPGRFVHHPRALDAVLEEAPRLARQPQEVDR